MKASYKFCLCIFFVYFLCSCCYAQEVYVSSSCGSDENTGLTPDTPLRTIAKAQKRGKTIFLKAGDVFHEYVGLSKQELRRYGKGKNPELNGFRYLEKGQWKKVEKNLWLMDLTKAKATGYIVEGSSELNNIGCFYEYDKDQIHGRRCEKETKMKANWDFYQGDTHDFHEKKNHSFDSVYLYYDGDPNQLNLAISVGSHYGLFLSDASVENVNIKGFGTGGINLIGTVTVRGCRIDMVGGSMMLNSQETVCLGNGIDFWLYRTSSDCIIEGNYISRCYDCGCSIQGARAGRATPKNIVFRDNLITDCCQGWEDFLRNDPDVKFENCRFENNIVINAGESGFGYPESRKKRCNVLGNNYEGDKGMIIRRNTFIGGNYYCSGAYQGRYRSNIWEGNIHYIPRGAYLLSNYIGSQDVIEVPESGSARIEIAKYRELTGDKSTKFKVCSVSRIDTLSKRTIKKYLRKHSY